MYRYVPALLDCRPLLASQRGSHVESLNPLLHLSFYNPPSTDPSLEILGQSPEQLLCPYIWGVVGRNLLSVQIHISVTLGTLVSANSHFCPSVSLPTPLQPHHPVLALTLQRFPTTLPPGKKPELPLEHLLCIPHSHSALGPHLTHLS